MSCAALVKPEELSGAHMDMWHLLNGWKSTIMYKGCVCNPRNQWQLDIWHEKTILLTRVDPTSLGEGEKNQPRKREKDGGFLERETLTSL